MKMGMQAKFTLFAVPCIALFAGILSVVIIAREEELLLRGVTQQGLDIARVSSVLFTNALVYEELGLVDTSGMADYLDYFVSDVMRLDARIVYFMVFDASGRVIAHNNLREYGKVHSDPATVAALGASGPLVSRNDDAAIGPHLDIAAPLAIGSKRWGACRIGYSLREMNERLDVLRAEVLGASAVLLLTALALVWYAGRHFSRPLTALTRTMNDITARGDLDAPLGELPARDDEIGVLQASFLWMVQRLRKAERDRLRTIEGMHRAEKLASIGQLASGVAHEINNPLGGVILCFRNLTSGGMDEPTRRQHEAVIDDGLEKIRRIVGELLHYARPTPLSVRPTPIEDLFARTRAFVAFTLQRQHVELAHRLDPDLPPLSVDPDKMGQVLLNLVLNAADAMPSGGTLSLDARADGETVRIAVRDTGPGVPPEHRERIFDPFFTTKPSGSGTGLGLAVSAAIVARHGGTLTLESPDQAEAVGEAPGEGCDPGHGPGACFVIRLPLSKDAP
ncbi:MAG: ATP-binding protein [Solidesulfovibrio sp.]|uniref:ATP-binding protein n=1 Tax=Solidesulfovibrio sp. TaxID=2910990 RepID=UPI003157FE0F